MVLVYILGELTVVFQLPEDLRDQKILLLMEKFDQEMFQPINA